MTPIDQTKGGAHPASQDRAGHEPSRSTASRPVGDHPIAQFTPGPWIALKDRHNEFYLIDTAPGNDSDNGYVIADDIRGKQRHANARLIAKAPDMAALIADIEESFTADDSYALLREACRKLLREIGCGQ